MAKAEFSSSQQFSDPQEACGITAILGKNGQPVSLEIPRLQFQLRNRGRDSAGMAAFNREEGRIVVYKAIGSVQEVYRGRIKKGELITTFDFAEHNLVSDVAIGHNRYGTSGDANKDSDLGAQPMMMEWEGESLALAFNGNIPQFERAILKGIIPPAMPKLPNFDTNDLMQAIMGANGSTIEERLHTALEMIPRAYALSMLTGNGEVLGLRSPSGTWPLWVGESADKIVFASETAVDTRNEYTWSMVRAGELVKATPDGVERTQLLPPAERVARCTYHDLYMANPHSQLNETTLTSEFRNMTGQELAFEHELSPDMVTGIPRTAKDMAEGVGKVRGISPTELFRVSRIAKRSYISKNMTEVRSVLKKKFKPVNISQVKGKIVEVDDDSLIKGSTFQFINKLLSAAGAKEKHNRSAGPKVVSPCEMGVFMDESLLVALEPTEEGYRVRDNSEIAEAIGADTVEFLSIEGIESVYQTVFEGKEHACTDCMFRKPSVPLQNSQTRDEAEVQP